MWRLHKNWCFKIKCFGQYLFIGFDFGIFAHFEKMINGDNKKGQEELFLK
jgi:hypothetical protein